VGEQVRDHVTPLLPGSAETVAETCVVPFPGTVLLATAMESTEDGIVTLAVAFLVLSVTEVAVNVTVMSLAGGVAGAVYVTAAPLDACVGETLPQGAVGQETVQFARLPAGSLFTMAVKGADALTCIVEVLGETDTTIAGTVILADAVLLGSEADAAVTVTVRSLAGAEVGAK
jgi:hypothetical protein